MLKNSGFTLIEAVIVLALIGIVSAISVISMSQWMPGYHLKSAAQDLFNNMHYAKSQAITENRPWAVVFDVSSPHRYVIVSSGPDHDISTVADNVETRSVMLSSYGSGVDFGYKAGTTKADEYPSTTPVANNVDYADGKVVFNPNGTVVAKGSVYLTNKNQQTYAVGTFVSGLVRLKQWDGSSWQ